MPLTYKDIILGQVSMASQALGRANTFALKANPMASVVPVLKELTTISFRLHTILSEINKVPGLDNPVTEDQT